MSNFFSGFTDLFKSQPEHVQRINPLRSEQEGLYQQWQQAMQGPGAGGATGDAADYYRSLMSGEGAADFEAPLQRQFQEDIMPGIAERFAGMGSGALSSSGFQQQASRAGTDLAERLGSIRAGLRMQGAQGLQGMAQQGMQPVDEMMLRPREGSFFEKFAGAMAPAVGAGAGMAIGGPAGAYFG